MPTHVHYERAYALLGVTPRRRCADCDASIADKIAQALVCDDCRLLRNRAACAKDGFVYSRRYRAKHKLLRLRAERTAKLLAIAQQAVHEYPTHRSAAQALGVPVDEFRQALRASYERVRE